MARTKTTKAPALLAYPCSFGNIGIGDKTARIGVQVARGKDGITLQKADMNLVERRLAVSLEIGGREADADGQGTLPGMEDSRTFAGTADVKGISVSADSVSFGLTFMLADVDIGELAHFAKRTGKLTVEASEEIPEGAAAEEHAGAERVIPCDREQADRAGNERKPRGYRGHITEDGEYVEGKADSVFDAGRVNDYTPIREALTGLPNKILDRLLQNGVHQIWCLLLPDNADLTKPPFTLSQLDAERVANRLGAYLKRRMEAEGV